MTQFQILCKLVTRHSYTPGNLCPDGKNCAVPVSHRDYFVSKDEVQWPVLRQVTPTNFIAGPLAQIFQTHGLSPRAVFRLFNINKKISAFYQDMPLAHKTICLPAAFHIILLTK